MANGTVPSSAPQFPTHNAPRVWLITSGDSPIGISTARQVLDHGDYVVSGILQAEFENDGARSQEFKDFLSEVGRSSGWKDRLKVVALDIRFAFILLVCVTCNYRQCSSANDTDDSSEG
jgi:hypothetical protein